MGRASAASRRAAGFAVVLVLAAALTRLLTLSLPAAQRGGEIGLGVGLAVYAVAASRLSRHDWMDGDLAVIGRGLILGIIAALMVGLAAGHFDRLDVVAVLLFTAVHLTAPPHARAWAVLAATLLVDGAFAAVWLHWVQSDVPTLLFAIAFMSALQLIVIAQSKAAGASAESDKLRNSAHAATAERVGTAIDVLGVTRAVLETSRESYPMVTHAAVLLYDAVADRLRRA